MTLDELAKLVHKSKATLSKYERGDISMDIDTLCALAEALRVHPEQLLHFPTTEAAEPQQQIRPAFFQGLDRFYSYFFDGRDRKLRRSAFDLLSQIGVNRYRVVLYMNYSDLEHYQQAENTYWGYIEHFDTLSLIELTHENTPTEKASIQILASFLDAETKWGLWNGVSSRPLMPIAAKMLFSKKPLTEDAGLLRELKISAEDIRRLKYYNMFSAT